MRCAKQYYRLVEGHVKRKLRCSALEGCMHATCAHARSEKGSAENYAAGWEAHALWRSQCRSHCRPLKKKAFLCSAAACCMIQPLLSGTVKHGARAGSVHRDVANVCHIVRPGH